MPHHFFPCIPHSLFLIPYLLPTLCVTMLVIFAFLLSPFSSLLQLPTLCNAHRHTDIHPLSQWGSGKQPVCIELDHTQSKCTCTTLRNGTDTHTYSSIDMHDLMCTVGHFGDSLEISANSSLPNSKDFLSSFLSLNPFFFFFFIPFSPIFVLFCFSISIPLKRKKNCPAFYFSILYSSKSSHSFFSLSQNLFSFLLFDHSFFFFFFYISLSLLNFWTLCHSAFLFPNFFQLILLLSNFLFA